MDENNQLGIEGELTMRRILNSHKVVSSPPDNDVNGWDCFIEIDLDNNEYSFENINGSIESKAQIKATYDEKNHVDITLSVLEKLVNSPLPSYIVLLKYNKNKNLLNGPEEIYLKHIDKEMIYDILKTIHERASKNKDFKKNKSKKRVKFKEYEKVNFDNFVCSLINYVNEVGKSEYSGWKSELVDKIGYENGSHVLKISDSPDKIDNFMSLLIKDDYAKVENFECIELIENRFNIVNENSKEVLNGISLVAEPHKFSGVLSFKKDTFVSNSNKLNSDFYCFYFGNEFGIKIINDFFNIIIKGKKVKIDFNNLKNNKFNLFSLKKGLELLKDFFSEEGVFIDLEDASGNNVFSSLFVRSKDELFLEELIFLIYKIKSIEDAVGKSTTPSLVIEFSLYDILSFEVEELFKINGSKVGGKMRIVNNNQKFLNNRLHFKYSYFISIGEYTFISSFSGIGYYDSESVLNIEEIGNDIINITDEKEASKINKIANDVLDSF